MVLEDGKWMEKMFGKRENLLYLSKRWKICGYTSGVHNRGVIHKAVISYERNVQKCEGMSNNQSIVLFLNMYPEGNGCEVATT